MEKILCSAIWYEKLPVVNTEIDNSVILPKNIKSGFVICGFRHHHCIILKSILTGKRDAECGEHIQGFLTNKNRFIDRIAGAIIASKSGQIKEISHGQRLYSEDLY